MRCNNSLYRFTVRSREAKRFRCVFPFLSTYCCMFVHLHHTLNSDRLLHASAVVQPLYYGVNSTRGLLMFVLLTLCCQLSILSCRFSQCDVLCRAEYFVSEEPAKPAGLHNAERGQEQRDILVFAMLHLMFHVKGHCKYFLEHPK